MSEQPTLVSRRKLRHLLGLSWGDLDRIACRAGHYYRPFDRRRVRGVGSWRHIDNPYGVLKDLQTRILHRVLHAVVLPPTMCGGVPGKSTKNHAQAHVGQALVATLDLKSCFPRTPYDRIYDVYCERLGCSPTIAGLLTRLTTFQGRVPQGAPTSPTLVNLSLLGLHDELAELAATLGLNMSFYVDDIAFSGPRAREALEPAIRTIMRYGHTVTRKKTKLMSLSTRQEITSQVVNEIIGASREKRESLYRRIHALASEENPRDGSLKSIRGEVAYMSWLNPVQGAALAGLADRLLPDVGVEGKRNRSDEVRRCRHRRRHRAKSAKAEAQASLT